MLRSLLLFLVLLALPVGALGQITVSPGGTLVGIISESTVANLPTGQNRGTVRIVTDGNSASDCTTGGGSSRVLCNWNGTAWAALGDGAGGSSPAAGANTQVTFNDGGTPAGDAGLTYNKTTDVLTVVGGITGNASTATALAANGANCTNQFPRGVDASGAAEGCASVSGTDMTANTVGPTQIDETAAYNWSGTTRVSGTLEFDAVSPAQITANQDDYAGCAGKPICRVTSDAAGRTITSFAGPGNWRVFLLENVGSFPIILDDQASTGTAANRILSQTAEDITVALRQIVLMQYDNTTARWRAVPLGSQRYFVKTVDPTLNNDQAGGFKPGDIWLNTTPSGGSFCIAISVATGAAVWKCSSSTTPALQAVSDVGRIINNAVDATTSLRIGNGTIFWGYFCDSANVCQAATMDSAGVLIPSDWVLGIDTNKNFVLRDKEAGADMWTIDPDAASPNAMYQFAGVYKPKTSVIVALSPRGAATMVEENILANQPKSWWGTLTDADTDAFDFYFPVTKKMEGATVATVALTGVSKNATPSGNIQLHCAMKSYRPGTDTYEAHQTTGEQAVTLTPATQNRAVRAVTANITINGTIAEGGEIIGSCEVSAAGTTSTQLTDFRLRGFATIQFLVNSWSD